MWDLTHILVIRGNKTSGQLRSSQTEVVTVLTTVGEEHANQVNRDTCRQDAGLLYDVFCYNMAQPVLLELGRLVLHGLKEDNTDDDVRRVCDEACRVLDAEIDRFCTKV